MSTTDKNGILRVEAGDSVAPLHPVFNALAQSVSDALDKNARIYNVDNIAGRNALVAAIGTSNITNASPLYVDRADASVGRNLEVTRNGASWQTIPTDQGSFIQRTTSATGNFTGTATWTKTNTGLVTVHLNFTRSGNWNQVWENFITPPSEHFYPPQLIRSFAPTYSAANSFRILTSLNTTGSMQCQIDPPNTTSSGANTAYLSWTYQAKNNTLA